MSPWILDEAVKFLRKKTDFVPSVALILGSGLGDFANQLKVHRAINSTEIPNYPKSSVQGHAGKLIFGYLKDGKRSSPPLLVFKGRVHFYETGKLEPVILPVQLASALGAKTLLVTNAAGGINRNFRAGDLMIIRDVIGLTFSLFCKEKSPHHKSGESIPHFDPQRILKRSESICTPALIALIRSAASNIGLPLKEGTYCWLKGPTYETAAEIEMLYRVGVDAVGMSTVPEISTAIDLGMKVAGLSLISNLATGISPNKLSHEEVTETANRVKKEFTKLMKEVLFHIR